MTKFLSDVNYFFDRSNTFYPKKNKKKWYEKILDQLIWFLRYREFNRNYYLYGLDRKGVSIDGYISGRKLDKIRRKNSDVRYICMVSDKIVFGRFFRSMGYPVPKTKAIITDDKKVRLLCDNKVYPLSEAFSYNGEYVCKPIDKGGGEGVFLVKVEEGKMYINGSSSTISKFSEKINGTYLLQRRITQHEKMNSIHPHSVNTIRLLTVRRNNESELIASLLRVGTKESTLDNWNSGGIAVSVNKEKGRTVSPGLMKKEGKCIEVHPDTGVSFDGYDIPYYTKSVKLVKKAHTEIGNLGVVGWDVAITKNGPVILECNYRWDGSLHMSLEENFKDKYISVLE